MSSFLVLKKKLDLGGSSGTSMLVGKRYAEIPTPEPDLPYDAQVKYLGFTGTQYIDTLIKPTNHFTEIRYYVPSYVSDGHLLGTSSGDHYYHWTEYANKYFWGQNGDNGQYSPWTSAIHTVEYNKGSNYSVILDGTTVGSGSQIYSANNLWIGRRDTVTNFQGYVYYCRITDKASGEIVRDLIPVRVGNVGYMYDKVSKELFANAGSGSFTLGGDIVPIEYIESTGTQWIDTRITPTEKTSAQFKVYNKVSTGDVIFGYTLENDNRDWRIFNGNNIMYLDIMSSRVQLANAWQAGSWRELEIGNNYVKDLQTDQTILNGSTIGSFTGDHTITLNNFHDRLYSQNKWSYVKIYENSVLVRDMIPVRIGETGYMYDKVSSRLFGNSGSGSFVLGDDIPEYRFRYIRMNITKIRSSSSTVIQLSKIDLLDSNDQSFSWPSGTSVTCKIQGSNSSGNGVEVPNNIIDGSTSTKYCQDWSSNPIPCILTIDLGASNTVDIATYCKWQWYTANDISERDPVSFKLEASNDGENWLELDSAEDVNVTSTRKTVAYTGNIYVPGKAVTQTEAVEEGDLPVVTVLKKHFDVDIDVSFDSVGGSECEPTTYTLGKPYGSLPDTAKAQNIFNGWYTAPYDAEVQYLESDGSQYIDTGVYADTDAIGFMIDGTYLTSTTPEDELYPALGGYGDTELANWFEVYEENSQIYAGSIQNIEFIRYINQRVKYTANYFNDNKLSSNVGIKGNIGNDDIPVHNTAKFILFAEGFDDGSVSCFAKARLYGAAITKGDVLVRDFIPVRVGQTGYMYDKVSGQLFGNGGNGAFALGNDIPGSQSTQITEDSLVRCDINTLYAHWEYVDISEDRTEYVVQATSSYKKTGVYAANRYSSSQPVYIDWGDGSVAKLEGNISQLAHQYSSAGTYNVKISNNLTSFTPSYSNSTWYSTTSQNRYTLKNIVKVGSRVTSMPTYAFYYCQALSSVDFLSEGYSGLTAIPSYAFYYCQSIQSLSSLPSKIKNIGQYGFRYCTGLNGIQDLRNTGLTGITGAYALANCTNVKEWKLPDTLTAQYFGTGMFINNSNLSAINLPNSLTSISQQCFYGCTQLKSIEIPANVRQIDTQAFYIDQNLTSVTYLGNQLTSIGNNAFYQCSRLISPSIPYSVQRIDDEAFSDCYQLSGYLALPSSLTSIGNYAYKYCQSLKSVSIPSSLTSIGEYAFARCDSISSISAYGMEAPNVYANTFGDTNDGEMTYTGYSTRGQNTLYTYVLADGYENGGWLDPLQNQDKCGFNMRFIDPENVHYCEITLDARAGSVSPSSLTCIQGKKMLSLPTPTAPSDLPNFAGWFTERHGEGDKYTMQSTVPSQSALTLYAYYTEAPDTSITVDLNGSWRANTNDNPDPSTYDMYESYSNQYQDEDASLAMMKIHSSGYTQLSVWIRSYAESDYDYCVAFNEDFDAQNTDWNEYTGGNFEWTNFNDLDCTKRSTSGNQNSGTSLESYTLVTYDLDGGEHDIWIAHRKDGSAYDGTDQSYILVPKSSGGGGDADDGIYLEDGETQLYDENQTDQTVQED